MTQGNRHPRRIWIGLPNPDGCLAGIGEGGEVWCEDAAELLDEVAYRHVGRDNPPTGCVWIAPDCGKCGPRLWCEDNVWTDGCEEAGCRCKAICYAPICPKARQ